MVADPTTTPTSQGVNGWGFKVADYFILYNQVALDSVDMDFGSGGPLLCPTRPASPDIRICWSSAAKRGNST